MAGLLPAIGQAQLPAVSLAASAPAASETGLTAGSFFVSRTGSTAAALSVLLTRAGTATNSTDYVFVASSVSIPAGQAGVIVAITPLRDNLVEGTESVDFTLAPSASYSIATPEIASVNIADDPAIVSLVASDPQADEAGASPGEFTISRSGGDTAVALSVNLVRQGTASNASDYVFVPPSLGIPAGQVTTLLPIVPIRDNLVEGDESVILQLGASASYIAGGSAMGSVNIADDPAVVTLVATDADADEAGIDPGEFTFARTGGDLATALSVPIVRAGSASNASDYVFVSPAISLPANVASVALPVTPLRDNLVEASETVELSLAASANFVPGTSASGTVTLADDPARVSVTAIDVQAAESGLDSGLLRLVRSGGDQNVALSVSLQRTGTAANASDYQFISTSAPFLAGADTLDIQITPIADNLVEGEESVIIAVAPSITYLVEPPGAATVTIADDPPVVGIDATLPIADECTGTPGRFTIARGGGDRAAALQVTVARSGTATIVSDYDFIGTSFAIAAGSDARDVAVSPVFDEIEEADESVVLQLQPSGSYLIAPPDSAMVTIANCMIQLFEDGFESLP